MNSRRFTLHPEVPTLQDFKKLSEEADRRFSELSEEDQMLQLLAPRLSFASSESTDKEGTYRRLIEKDFGPKFATRVLADPECRRKLGLT